MNFCFKKFICLFKNKIIFFISFLCLLIPTQSIAFVIHDPRGNCLPTNVSVLDENGNTVLVNRFELEKNSLFRGSLIPGNTPGSVQYSTLNVYTPSCSNDIGFLNEKDNAKIQPADNYAKYVNENYNYSTSSTNIGIYIKLKLWI